MIKFETLRNKLKLIKKNKEFFFNQKTKNQKKILVEHYELTGGLIPFSYFANVLSKKYNADIYSYKVNYYNFFQKIRFIIKNLYLVGNYNIYKSFGTKKLILPEYKSNKNTEKFYFQIKKNIKKKDDVLKIKFKNIKLGEFIYDEYLRSFNLSTIDVKSNHFHNYLKHVIKLCYFWDKTLVSNEIKALIISHSTYLLGLVATIAIYKGIPVYRVSTSSTFYLTKKFPRSYSDFSNYKQIAKKISIRKKRDLLIKSKLKNLKFFLGNNINSHKLKKKNNVKFDNLTILISAHCFTDAVHPHGLKNCFSDFYEWLDYLGKFSKKTNHNWIIKLHPQEYDDNFNKIQYFLKKYPKFKLLNKDIKNKSLINKIDIVLTVYGSVGREFPLFNIPVINASTCGPHCGYKFNYHFDDIKKYDHALKNLKKFIQNFKSNKKDIFELFYMRYYIDYSFYYNADFAIDLNENFRVGKINHEEMISIWLKIANNRLHNKIYKNVEKFIESKQNRFTADNTKEYSEFMPIKFK